MAKKVAPKKAAKPVKKAAKPAPKKVAAKPAAKKAVKPAAKAPAKKKAAAKPAPKKAVKAAPAKKVVAKKPAPVKKAAPVKAAKSAAPAKAQTKPAAKPVAKAPAPAKPVAKPAPKAVEAKPAPKNEKPVSAPAKPVKKETKKEEKAALKEAKAAAANKPLVTQIVAPNRPMSAPIVKKQVSTLEREGKLRYSDDELTEFRDLINRKLDEARKDYDLLKQTLANTDNNGTDDTSPSFKMIEDGSETLSREETAQLAGRQEKFIKHLEDALLRIRNKTYGICRVTGRLISKERLRLVPHATLSIEAKQQMGN